METYFQLDTEEERRKLLIQARKAALSALQQYNVEWKSISFIQLSDTITFKIETELDGCFLLRIHSNRMNKDEIQSEIMLLYAVNENMTVPTGVPSRDGDYVLVVTLEDGVSFCVTLMRWLEGDHSDQALTDQQLLNMGALMAKFHEEATVFDPPSNFTRPTWGVDSFNGDMKRLEMSYGCFLSNEAWQSYQKAAKKIVNKLASMRSSISNYGLIHADLHLGNFIFNGDEPLPIDFGRCGFGFHLYDIASTIVGLYPLQRKLFIQGYESVKKLEANYSDDLSSFFVMIMIENYCHHAPDSRETAGLIEEQPYAQAIIRDFLNDVPFLFNPIKPVEIQHIIKVETGEN